MREASVFSDNRTHERGAEQEFSQVLIKDFKSHSIDIHQSFPSKKIMALSMTSVRAPVAFRSAALAPRVRARVSPVVHQRRSLVVRAEVRLLYTLFTVPVGSAGL